MSEANKKHNENEAKTEEEKERRSKAIGEIVKHLRGLKKISRKDLATKINSSLAYITRLEEGNIHLSVNKLFDVSKALGVDVSAVLPTASLEYDFFSEKSMFENITHKGTISEGDLKELKYRLLLKSTLADAPLLHPYAIEYKLDSIFTYLQHPGWAQITLVSGKLKVLFCDNHTNETKEKILENKFDTLVFNTENKHAYIPLQEKTRAIITLSDPRINLAEETNITKTERHDLPPRIREILIQAKMPPEASKQQILKLINIAKILEPEQTEKVLSLTKNTPDNSHWMKYTFHKRAYIKTIDKETVWVLLRPEGCTKTHTHDGIERLKIFHGTENIEIKINDKIKKIEKNKDIFIPPNTIHQTTNLSKNDIILFQAKLQKKDE